MRWRILATLLGGVAVAAGRAQQPASVIGFAALAGAIGALTCLFQFA